MPSYNYASAYVLKFSADGQATLGADKAGTLSLTSSDAVLTDGSTLTETAQIGLKGQTFTYVGTVVDNGKYVGFAVTDSHTNKTYLITDDLNLTPHSNLTIDYSNNPIPGSKSNFDLATDSAVVCFLAGTAIQTPDGEVPVEKLQAGDLVTVSDGRALPVRWLGRQTVAQLFADPLRILPIRIKADALGPNEPQRDLLLSPDHAILVDGVLVQAAALVNGLSIVRETKMPPVFTYYHVEVADHSLVYAEGVQAETFIDNVDRLGFDNWAEHEALHGDGVTITEMDLPRAKAVRQVPQSTRTRLAARMAELFEADVASAA